jgi:hypothetical protein
MYDRFGQDLQIGDFVKFITTAPHHRGLSLIARIVGFKGEFCHLVYGVPRTTHAEDCMVNANELSRWHRPVVETWPPDPEPEEVLAIPQRQP